MIFLISGLIIFFTLHVLPSLSQRDTLVNRLGIGPYKGLYSLLSLAGLGLIIYGKAYAGVVEVWQPPVWTRYLTIALMPIALFLLAMPDFPNNFRRSVQHPMMTGILVWSFAHLCANGDLASILLFASFFAYSIFSIVSVTRRKPFVKKDAVKPAWNLLLIVFVVIAYGTIFHFHQYVSGMPLR